MRKVTTVARAPGSSEPRHGSREWRSASDRSRPTSTSSRSTSLRRSTARRIGSAARASCNSTQPVRGRRLRASPVGRALLRDLGLDVDWQVITGDEPFFRVTKAIHNGLQGDPHGLTDADRDAYLATSARNAELLEDAYDFVVVHDPQPAAVLPMHGKGGHAGSGAATSRRPSRTRRRGTSSAAFSATTTRPSSRSASSCRPICRSAASRSCRRRSTRSVPRTCRWRGSRRRRCSIGSACASMRHSSRRSRASTRGRTRSA